MVVLPFRGTSRGWRNDLTETSLSSTRGKAKPCIWWGTTPGQIHAWADQLESSAAEKDMGVLVYNKLTLCQHYSLEAKNTKSLMGCITRRIICSWLSEAFPSTLPLVSPRLECWTQVCADCFLFLHLQSLKIIQPMPEVLAYCL